MPRASDVGVVEEQREWRIHNFILVHIRWTSFMLDAYQGILISMQKYTHTHNIYTYVYTHRDTDIHTFSNLIRKQSIKSRGSWISSVFWWSTTFLWIKPQSFSISAKVFVCCPGKYSIIFGKLLYTYSKVQIK